MRAARAMIVLGVVAMMLGRAPDAWACSCAVSTEEEAIAAAGVVFDGVAVDVRPLPQAEDRGVAVASGAGRETRFHVIGRLKGRIGDEALVGTNGDGASCGFTFGIGRRYRVMARGDDDPLTTNLCSGTRPLGADEPGSSLAAAGTGDDGGQRTIAIAVVVALLIAVGGGLALRRAYLRSE